MRRTVLVLDASEAMNQTADLKPTRLTAVWRPIVCFAAAYLEADPIARISVVLLRDGIAKRVCAATSNVDDVESAIRVKYAEAKGSGTFSIVNGLNAVMAELGDPLDPYSADSVMIQPAPPQPGSQRTAPAVRVPTANSANAEIILLSGSVTSIDAGDIFKTLTLFRSRFNSGVDAATGTFVGVPKIHIISLDGSPHVLQHIATATNGELLCPMNAEHFARVLLHLLPKPVEDSRYRGTLAQAGQGSSRRRGRADAFGAEGPAEMSMVGLIAESGVAAGAGLCPLCHAAAPPLPAPCRSCGIALLEEGVAGHAEMASKARRWVPLPSQRAAPDGSDEVASVSKWRCVACTRDVGGASDLLQCELCTPSGCAAADDGVCIECAFMADTQLHCCPVCGALGD
jgi:hypothetical protein